MEKFKSEEEGNNETRNENNESHSLESERELRAELIAELGRWRRTARNLGAVALLIWGVNSEAYRDTANRFGLPKFLNKIENKTDNSFMPSAEELHNTENLILSEIEKILKETSDRLENGEPEFQEMLGLKNVFEQVKEEDQ